MNRAVNFVEIVNGNDVVFQKLITQVEIQKGEIDSAYYYSEVHQKLSSGVDNPFQKMRNNRIKGMIALHQKPTSR